MDPERWRLVKRLVEKALSKAAGARDTFLREACGGDGGLRRDVEEILARYNEDGFLEIPASETVPELFEEEIEEDLAGSRRGVYEIIQKIGSGGTGVVYLAHDTRLDRQVALKKLSALHTGDDRQRERLKLEALAAAKLVHPGIATVFSLEESGDDLFIISEYVPGRTLHQVIDDGTLSFHEILDIAVQLASALDAAHEKGIIHRDIKPENIIRTGSGNIKILDFGLARMQSGNSTFSNPRLTTKGMFVGTPAYASPEQLLAQQVDRTTDLFSLGIILYELASGHHPFGTNSSMATVARILENEVAPLPAVKTDIPEAFDRIVRRCLDKKPDHRYASTRDLLIELQQLTGVETGNAPKVTAASGSAFWWWQFHQACAGFGYYGMVYPMWRVKEWLGGIEGSLYFFPALIAVGISANLRLHLWFTSRFYRSELAYQRRKVSRWIRGGDWLFVFMLAAAAVRIHTDHAIIATLLMSVSIGSLVAFSLIEPTTTNAALDRDRT